MPCALQVVFKKLVQKEFAVDLAFVAIGVVTFITSIVWALTPIMLAKGPFMYYVSTGLGGWVQKIVLFVYFSVLLPAKLMCRFPQKS